MSTANLVYRSYEPGDESAILKLFQDSFGRDLGLEAWRWRFQENPAGPGTIQLAWDGAILAAHYAVTAVSVRIAGRDWLSGLSGTTMTHPDYRGQGLFPVLAAKTYEAMDQSGMALVWGFPNAMSHRGFIKDLGWNDIYEVPTLRLTLSGASKLPAVEPAAGGPPVFDDRLDGLWERMKDAVPITARRDRRHLQWRYGDNPTDSYRTAIETDGPTLLGYAVFKRYKDELQVVDLFTEPDPEIGVRLLARVAAAAKAEDATAVSLWLPLTHPLHHALEKYGFRLGEPVTYFGGLAFRSQLDVYDFRRWYLTMGDSDVF